MLLVCEEGVEEYEPSRFASQNVYLERIDDESALDPNTLEEALKKCRAKRVIVEYNGMWLLKSLFDNMPKTWFLAQEFMFADATTFLNYNANMRQLVVDKLNTCELIVFNRFRDDIDFMQLHKIVRGTSRRADIAYEYPDGSVKYDDIEDPLPFDVNAPIIEIEDADFALWYRDLSENMPVYAGKTVRFKCLVNKTKVKDGGYFICGRNVMTCCVQDIQFAGLVCNYPKSAFLQHKQWIRLTAKISLENHRIYGRVGPVLTATTVSAAEPPAQEVATFF